jgi:phage-related protein
MDRDLLWLGSTLEDLREASEDVRETMGIALRVAQNGGKSDDAKPMHGVLREVTEISTQDESGAYRLMYAARLGSSIFVLDFFQKKSKSGISTPKADLDRIEARLKQARQLAAELEKQHG